MTFYERDGFMCTEFLLLLLCLQPKKDKMVRTRGGGEEGAGQEK